MVFIILGLAFLVVLIIMFVRYIVDDNNDSIFDKDGNYKPYKFPWED